jgi:copper(I)-binding protein
MRQPGGYAFRRLPESRRLEHAVIRNRWASAPGRPVLAGRLALAAAAAAALIPGLAGCEAGINAPTLQFHPPTDSASENAGSIAIRNLFVLGAPLGRNLAAGSSASVFLSLINTNTGAPDRLLAISAQGTATSVTLPVGGIPVVAGHPVYDSGPFPRVVLLGLTRPVRSGTSVRLTLNFATEGPVIIEVPVMPRAAQYATLAPPAVTQVPAAAPHAGRTATPSPGATASASPTATPAP